MMKAIFKTIVACSVGLVLAGCAKEYDDSALKNDVNSLKSQIEQIQNSIRSLNGQVTGLTETIEQWKKGGYVESIQELADKSGYTITFSGGKTVTLYHGTKGENGQAPTLKADTDGTFYWAMDGEFILVDGKKVPAAVAPVFSVNADGDLIMSLSGKETNLGHVQGTPGPAGESLFEKIEPGKDVVVFTLKGGDTFSIPIAKAFKLVIDQPEQEVTAGQKLEIAYTVQNGNENTVVDCFAAGNYTAKIADGKVVVGVPDPVVDGQVLVWAQNDYGLFSMVKLTFMVKAEVVVVTPETDYQTLPGEGGTFDINLTSNVDVDVKLPEEATWLKAVMTRADYKLALTFEENTTGAPREAEIDIVRTDNGASVQRIKVIQLAGGEAEKVLTLERVWGFYKEGDTPWFATTNITAVSIAHPDGYGMARGLAMDDEFIYLPKASGYANVAAVSIADKTVQKALNKSGVAGGSTFATSFVRMIKNTDASVNGGKDILLLCNLTSTDSDANQLKLYAYKDGVDAAPTKIAAFCWDSANNVNDWRRYGDRFFVEGDWSNAKVYFPSFNANKTVVLSIANGARTAVTQIAAGAANSPDGIKDLTVYPGDNKLFLTNNSIANLVAPTGGKSNGWDEYSLSASCSEAVGTWGYNFFEFNGKKYIAYARIIGETKAQIEIVEDKGDLLTSLSAKEGLMVSPIHDATDLDKEVATGNAADCCVRVIGEEVYIAALTRDGGFVLDKLYLK